MFRAFLSNLKLRDRAIALALLSTSHDSGDLFSLNVGFVRNQVDLQTKEPRERLYWEGRRGKTGVRFKVFFSKEATKTLRQYLEQERKDAEDDEPLFTRMGGYGRMTSGNFAFICREVAIKMGFHENGSGYQSPLLPKRMRHLFRTACDYAGIKEEGYVHVFMGHRSGISARYLQTPIWRLEQEYARVEKVLSVFAYVGDDLIKVRRELEEKFEQDKTELQQIVNKLTAENLDFRETIKALVDAVHELEDKYSKIEQEFEIREAIRESEESSPEEIKRAKKTLQHY